MTDSHDGGSVPLKAVSRWAYFKIKVFLQGCHSQRTSLLSFIERPFAHPRCTVMRSVAQRAQCFVTVVTGSQINSGSEVAVLFKESVCSVDVCDADPVSLSSGLKWDQRSLTHGQQHDPNFHIAGGISVCIYLFLLYSISHECGFISRDGAPEAKQRLLWYTKQLYIGSSLLSFFSSACMCGQSIRDWISV